MVLKPTVKKGVALIPVQKQQEEKKPRKSQKNSLPSDEYKPLFDPIRLLVREKPSNKDCTKMVKQYVEISVKRFNDELGLPFVWLQMYQESEQYTGYLSGKTVYFPLEYLYEVLDALHSVDEECDKRHIE